MSKVLVIMGSDSDLPVVKAAVDVLQEFDIEAEVRISSAHRAPDKTEDLAKNAAGRGFNVIIAAAGGAAHLAGVIAAQTPLPVIALPIRSGALNGLDEDVGLDFGIGRGDRAVRIPITQHPRILDAELVPEFPDRDGRLGILGVGP